VGGPSPLWYPSPPAWQRSWVDRPVAKPATRPCRRFDLIVTRSPPALCALAQHSRVGLCQRLVGEQLPRLRHLAAGDRDRRRCRPVMRKSASTARGWRARARPGDAGGWRNRSPEPARREPHAVPSRSRISIIRCPEQAGHAAAEQGRWAAQSRPGRVVRNGALAAPAPCRRLTVYVFVPMRTALMITAHRPRAVRVRLDHGSLEGVVDAASNSLAPSVQFLSLVLVPAIPTTSHSRVSTSPRRKCPPSISCRVCCTVSISFSSRP